MEWKTRCKSKGFCLWMIGRSYPLLWAFGNFLIVQIDFVDQQISEV
jgi:hypothetical protein